MYKIKWGKNSSPFFLNISRAYPPKKTFHMNSRVGFLNLEIPCSLRISTSFLLYFRALFNPSTKNQDSEQTWLFKATSTHKIKKQLLKLSLPLVICICLHKIVCTFKLNPSLCLSKYNFNTACVFCLLNQMDVTKMYFAFMEHVFCKYCYLNLCDTEI